MFISFIIQYVFVRMSGVSEKFELFHGFYLPLFSYHYY